ncbi:hypothetical protein GOP47_0012922 [Adiantum capillus-veneris]|uniref:Methyltransferase type 11 domain-containing protein n=1 Tax=Adiantum capillus-veneris TaxID=13818 RepID=A0A9D4URT3_ADICA|nr:hypothetical protein GOP47_0012922 [Adiantum capillus-veneris]
MGSEESHKSMESNRRIRRASQSLFFFVILLGSNFVTYFFFSCNDLTTSKSSFNGDLHNRYHQHLANAQQKQRADDDGKEGMPVAELVAGLVFQLNVTQADLKRTQQELIDVKAELRESRLELSHIFVDALAKNMELLNVSTHVLEGMHAIHESKGKSSSSSSSTSSKQDSSFWSRWMGIQDDADESHAAQKTSELHEYTALRPLPLGFNPGQGSDTMVSSIGHGCALEEDDLKKFMGYKVRGECPDDQNLAQRLLLHGCEPLPRRRCFARIPPNFTEPYPVPESFWTVPEDSSILWSAYICKSFKCLNDRKKQKVFDDCNDCFDLEGKERERWEKHDTELDFSIEEVLRLKNGSVRIGLDIGGGSASFAVRMMERGVTIVTTSMNLNGPFNNFIALRGVVPLYLTVAQRLPFFDNTLDIVHSMHVLSHWIPLDTLEFILFDIDRVLRPGGIFWLDHFFCGKSQLKDTYVPMIRGMGYRVHRWVTSPKMDRGRPEIYLSAVLEKPLVRNIL